jgi:hypothetical protein
MNEHLDSIPTTSDAVAPLVTTTIEVITGDELSLEEQRDRLHLERVIERSFYQAGIALKQLRDRRLYRSTHKTFEEYCNDRFGYSSRRQPYLLIEAAAVVDNLRDKCDPMDHIYDDRGHYDAKASIERGIVQFMRCPCCCLFVEPEPTQ